MAVLNVSFRCIENNQRTVEPLAGSDLPSQIAFTSTLYEDTFEVEKSQDVVKKRASAKIEARLSTRDFICRQIRKQLKRKGLPKRIYNAKIIITYMWDEYQLSENGSLC